MSEDTPECAKLQHLKKQIFLREHVTLPLILSNVFQDKEISNSLKNDTLMFEYGFTTLP